jgi:hypothetical protein
MLLWTVSIRHDGIQKDTILGSYLDFDTGAHAADSHLGTTKGILNRMYPLDFIH